MVVGMLGLGYVASHAKNEASIATGAAVVGGSPDVDDDGHEKELESVSPGQSNEETQPLQSGPRSDSNQKTSPESISAASHNGAADVERQGGVNVHPAGSLGRGEGSIIRYSSLQENLTELSTILNCILILKSCPSIK